MKQLVKSLGSIACALTLINPTAFLFNSCSFTAFAETDTITDDSLSSAEYQRAFDLLTQFVTEQNENGNSLFHWVHVYRSGEYPDILPRESCEKVVVEIYTKEDETWPLIQAFMQEKDIDEDLVFHTSMEVNVYEKSKGDVDCNETVQIADAILLARWLGEDKNVSVSARGLLNADMNDDKYVDAADLAKLLGWLAGVPDEEDQKPFAMRSVDLLADVQKSSISKYDPSETEFRSAQAGFSADLFRQIQGAETDKDKNLLISPLSVSLALGMAMNGAKGDTLTEMQNVLGGGLTADALNGYYAGWSDYLLGAQKVTYYGMDSQRRFDYITENSVPVTLANAIWIRDNEEKIHVPDLFLQTTADYYKAGAFKAPFDDSTVADINGWCDENTHHMIPKVIEQLSELDVMVLANALTFEDVWGKPYEDDQVIDDKFRASNGEERDVRMMCGSEGTYLDDGRATGFIKSYRDPRFCFAAVLPNEDITLDEYIAGFDGEALNNLLDTRTGCEVITRMPKFSFDYSVPMNNALSALGMQTAFEPGVADFTGLNDAEGMDTWIGQVFHKAHIELCESGTKAAAVTVIQMYAAGAIEDEPEKPQPKYVKLDRPFLFMILDRQNNLPVFIGTVKDIPAEG